MLFVFEIVCGSAHRASTLNSQFSIKRHDIILARIPFHPTRHLARISNTHTHTYTHTHSVVTLVGCRGTRDTNQLSGIFATLSLLFDGETRDYSESAIDAARCWHPQSPPPPPSPPHRNASDPKFKEKVSSKNLLHAQKYNIGYWRVRVLFRSVLDYIMPSSSLP